ncbi:Hypothetical_protein [Hexamita inflata]|uniref:Hypothetical_protein n=1 Tax=Hexamita inflata TaxID=28002 RepID=A0AA86R4I0_9EUKA|nr:Hypothetical protein HINF_LOCUS54551 [Hexamita inflata]
MRLGQIGCGRQTPRFKVRSYRQGSVWLRACHQRAFRIGKWLPLHCFLRNADGTKQVIPVQIGCRVTPLDACTRVVGCGGTPTQVCLKLMIIRVDWYKRKLSKWDIQLKQEEKITIQIKSLPTTKNINIIERSCYSFSNTTSYNKIIMLKQINTLIKANYNQNLSQYSFNL